LPSDHWPVRGFQARLCGLGRDAIDRAAVVSTASDCRAVERAADVDQARQGTVPIPVCTKAIHDFVVRASSASRER
jgi:hypothetical protein